MAGVYIAVGLGIALLVYLVFRFYRRFIPSLGKPNVTSMLTQNLIDIDRRIKELHTDLKHVQLFSVKMVGIIVENNEEALNRAKAYNILASEGNLVLEDLVRNLTDNFIKIKSVYATDEGVRLVCDFAEYKISKKGEIELVGKNWIE